MSADQVVDETGTELVAVRRGEVIRPIEVGAVKSAMAAYQTGLRQLLESSDYQSAGRDSSGRDRRFVKKSGLRKIATWFDLSVEMLRDDVERAPDGMILRATAWARAHAANGRYFDGDGHCDQAEDRFKDSRGRQKLENDLRATAATRAINRAISNLIGMGDLDEADDGERPPLHGPTADDATRKATGEACVRIAGGEPRAGVKLWQDIVKELNGYMPQAAAVALITAAAAISDPEPARSADAAS